MDGTSFIITRIKVNIFYNKNGPNARYGPRSPEMNE